MRSLSILLAACQSTGTPAPTPHIIEVRDAAGKVLASVLDSHPCRATVDGLELIVGGPPIVADLGATRWTGDSAPNGLTLRQNDEAVARIHAKQLFDSEGIPLIRVTDTGDIANGAGRIVRKAIAMPGDRIVIGDLTVTGLDGTPDHLALAAMLTAPEATREIRALAACSYLLGT